MAANASASFAIPLLWLLLLSVVCVVSASPILHLPNSPSSVQHYLIPRAAGFILNNSTGVPEVFDPVTRVPIPQGSASDGSGTGFDAPAAIWLAFSFVVGLPMAFAGFRGWRFTTGVGIGLAAGVCSWAALINTVSATGISDLLLTLITIGFFGLGALLGVFEIGRIGGIACLGIASGLSFGMRVMLLKSELLFSGTDLYAANWVITAVLGMAGGMSMISGSIQRTGILFACSSVGTFFTFLGIDLILNKQAGMSRGLRFLFDRNSSHIVDIVSKGYVPPISTQILLGVSLVLTPLLTYLQHRLFPQPFSRNPERDDIIRDSVSIDVNMSNVSSDGKRATFLQGLWDTARGKSPNRFSL
ncbi:hypothetical protein BDQ12DRAFT_674032 [Crucibulum laeve]|uniref:TM7S3/TM198-like domain-containing protein n=1 Tax=Crucibulum laeve TaxID=68775 RepID=A0A5C3MUJ2_9AGAR|nr:hypothetical protein BDQ12DRAFT_674032 [Crucibulum laeve]